MAIIESDESNIHGQKLAVFVKELLDSNNITTNELDAVAVSEGPGSYTGLRIGISIAKGICYAAVKQLIAIDTLHSLAYDLLLKKEIEFPDGCILMPMIDARRMEVYTAGYDRQLQKIIPTKPVILEETFYNSFNSTTFICGNGSAKISGTINNKLVKIVPHIDLSARNLGVLAFKKFERNEFEDIAYFEPLYLKEFATIL